MSCTTILVGKKASYDGSTIIARNDDAGTASGIHAKKFVIVDPSGQSPKTYKSVLSKVEIPLPERPMRYSAIPNAVAGEGIWAACGVNEKNVGMTATETITTNERVQAADPLVVYDPKRPEKAGGIGEEDMVTLVLPYIHSAREGVRRLGSLLETYGTYEMNGIAFSDKDEIWWMETIGGHHWMARRVPDECYAVIPNQLGLDALDLEDALGAQKEYMCSADLEEFIREHHLDLSQPRELLPASCEASSPAFCPSCEVPSPALPPSSGRIVNPRAAFGSHEDADHVYNTPRAWYALRFFNPRTCLWDGPDADFGPEDDDLPWGMIPEKKITPEDVKYILSSHYQGTPYDPYLTHGDRSQCNRYRSIGINRTNTLGMVQIRPYLPEACRALQWVAFGSNVFNGIAPFYPNVPKLPEYLSSTDQNVSTQNWYWTSRLIAALADASWLTSRFEIEHYSFNIQSRTRAVILEADRKIEKLIEKTKEAADPDGGMQKVSVSGKDFLQEQVEPVLAQANREIADILREEADETLRNVLEQASGCMKNRFARSDA